MGRSPLVLLYNLSNAKGSRLRLLCLKLGIRVKNIAQSEYAQPIGALAGLMPVRGDRTTEEDFGDEMLVMVHFDGALLNRFLAEIRAERLPGVALKAVMTPSNSEWNSIQLHEALRQEHEAMHYGADRPKK